MIQITAKMVKELRDITGAGMMDCKKALQETNGDIDKAVDYLREHGVAQAAKKSGRGKANIEDEIRTLNELIRGLEIISSLDIVAASSFA